MKLTDTTVALFEKQFWIKIEEVAEYITELKICWPGVVSVKVDIFYQCVDPTCQKYPGETRVTSTCIYY